MNLRLKKVDALIVATLIIISGLFLVKAGYVNTLFPSPHKPVPTPLDNTTSPPEDNPLPPSSLLPATRRDVSPEDEGVHYDELRIEREWWYYGALLNAENSELKNWVVQISFNHMARGDLLGTTKPDLLVVSLLSPDGDSYGGMINKKRYMGILTTGTLIATSPGVNVEFEDSWAEGQYPNWHVHAEDKDIDTEHEIIIDLDYHAQSLPIWTIGNRAFDKSESSIANYLFLGCNVTGTISIDGTQYHVNGTGHHEHAWTPNIVNRGFINGWDWFTITMKNGWQLYISNYYPTPQVITSKTSRLNPFGTMLLTTDNGQTFTELKNVDIKITRYEDKVFPLVKMPGDFTITGKPSIDPLYFISQSMLYGSGTKLDMDISVLSSCNQIWKFPTYVGMKTGLCNLQGTLSWSDDDGTHEIPLDGSGTSWSMRALL
jgi:predicted secreted hydrolase